MASTLRLTQYAILVLALALCSQPTTVTAGTPSPDDWRDLLIYQVVTDRFEDGDSSINDAEGAYRPESPWGVHGGDFEGIRQRLPYLQGMGVGAIWISPVARNAFGRYHGYHAQDFSEVSPQAGGLDGLRRLVDDAHDAGMYVIVDVVTNHMANLSYSQSPGWPAFRNPSDYVLQWERPTVTPAPPFDNLDAFHNHGHIGNYEDPEQLLGELTGLDDLRTESPDVRDALVDGHAWLIDEADIDGFRIDTVKHVELTFWQSWPEQMRERARESGKDSFFHFGEVLDGSDTRCGMYTGTKGGGPFALESVLAYPMYFTIRDVFLYGQGTSLIASRWNTLYRYDSSAQERLVTFLDNHDQARFLAPEHADGNQSLLRSALAFLLASRGIPTIYYGTEQGFNGSDDPNNREDFFDGQLEFGPSLGDNFDPASDLYRWIRDLGLARIEHPALRRGTTVVLESTGSGRGPFVFRRRIDGQSVVVAVNTDDQARTTGNLATDWGANRPVADLLRATTVCDTTDFSGSLRLELGPYQAALLLPVDETQAPRPWIRSSGPDHDQPTIESHRPLEINFTRSMHPASVASALTITPTVPGHLVWHAPHRVDFVPDQGWTPGTDYRIELSADAATPSGETVGSQVSWEFTGGVAGFAEPGPIACASGITSDNLAVGLITRPTAIAAGRGDAAWSNHLYVADEGTASILQLDPSGNLVDTLVVSSLLSSVSALAWDAGDGHLLASAQDGVVEITSNGSATLVFPWNEDLPAGDRPLAVSDDGTTYSASTEGNAVYEMRAVGPTAFGTSIRGVRGLETAGQDFGSPADILVVDANMPRDYDAIDGQGRIVRVSPDGTLINIVSECAELASGSSLLIDRHGLIDGHLAVADASEERIWTVSPGGEMRELATGFGNLVTTGCLAQEIDGAILVVDSGATLRWTGSRAGRQPSRIVRLRSDATGITSAGDNEGIAPVAGYLSPVFPNPSNPGTMIQFETTDIGQVELVIFDGSGRRIRLLVDGTKPAGNHAVRWDGRDHAGRPVPSGLYTAELRVGPERHRRSVVILR